MKCTGGIQISVRAMEGTRKMDTDNLIGHNWSPRRPTADGSSDGLVPQIHILFFRMITQRLEIVPTHVLCNEGYLLCWPNHRLVP